MAVTSFQHGLAALGLCVCAGCASIVSGPKQEIAVTSDPPGASVLVRDQTITTPGTITLARKQDYTVRVSKEGYYENMAELRSRENPWIVGNLLWDLPTTGLLMCLTQGQGGLIVLGPGSIYDRVTGAGYQLVPDKVHLVLDPRDPNDPEPAALTQWQPHIVKEIAMPTATFKITIGSDGVWVVRRTEGFLTWDSLLSRIDPTTNTVVATLPQAHAFTDFVVVDDALWYIADKYTGHCHLIRVDLRTNQETAQVPLPRMGARVVVGEGAVWALQVPTASKGLTLVTAGFEVLKLDPHTAAIQGRAALDASVWELPKNAHIYPSDIAVGLGSVWVVNESQQCVVRLDAQTAQVTAVVPTTHKVSRVLASGDAIWALGAALQPKHDPPTQVTRIDPKGNQSGHALCLGRAPRAITAGLGALWMLDAEEKSLQWLDTHTGKLTERALPLEDRFPGSCGQTLAVADGAVWVAAGDRVLRIAPTPEKE
jgi:streptogramin lyase